MHKIKKLSGPVFAIIAGIFIIKISLGKKEAPKEETLQNIPVKVQTKRLSKQRWSPKLTVYGTVHPHDFYQAVAEVSGRISWIHPQFQGGAIFSKEETLLRIESTDYEIDLKSAQSGLKELQNRVLELDKQEKQTVEMLELDQQSLTLALKEFERQSALEERGSTTQTVKDQAHQAYLSVKTRLKQKENQLETIPVQRESLMAKIE